MLSTLTAIVLAFEINRCTIGKINGNGTAKINRCISLC